VGLGQLLKREVVASKLAGAGALLMRNALGRVKRHVDHEEIGGAPLLGVRGAALVAHGRASARAICNALATAKAYAALGLEAELAAAAGRAEGLLAAPVS